MQCLVFLYFVRYYNSSIISILFYFILFDVYLLFTLASIPSLSSMADRVHCGKLSQVYDADMIASIYTYHPCSLCPQTLLPRYVLFVCSVCFILAWYEYFWYETRVRYRVIYSLYSPVFPCMHRVRRICFPALVFISESTNLHLTSWMCISPHDEVLHNTSFPARF